MYDKAVGATNQKKSKAVSPGEGNSIVSNFSRWRETVIDRSIAAGDGGILIDGRPLGLLADQMLRKSDESPKKGEIVLISLYSDLRKKHNDEHHFRYGKSVAKRFTDAEFDAKYGEGASERAIKAREKYHRGLHRCREVVIDEARRKKRTIIVNGVVFFSENGRWVTSETDAPKTLLSRAAQFAIGSHEKTSGRGSKKPLYPNNAAGLIKLGEETSPEFLALIIEKSRGRSGSQVSGNPAISISGGLKRPGEKESEAARKRIAVKTREDFRS